MTSGREIVDRARGKARPSTVCGPIRIASEKNRCGRNDEAVVVVKWVIWIDWEVFGSTKFAAAEANFCATRVPYIAKSFFLL
jgi:hypothetical protein